jgi:hypothetical protein
MPMFLMLQAQAYAKSGQSQPALWNLIPAVAISLRRAHRQQR